MLRLRRTAVLYRGNAARKHHRKIVLGDKKRYMDIKTVKNAVEAVLFAVGEPVAASRIAEAVEAELESVISAIDEIRGEYDARLSGICLLQMEDRYQLATRPMYAEFVQKALDTRRNSPLSQAAMETLSIIAYNQPVSRSFIEQVRGVDSSSSVANLVSKGLIAEAGRLDLPGRPISFRTTDVFLRSFGMRSLSELPPTQDDSIEYMQQMEIEEDALRS